MYFLSTCCGYRTVIVITSLFTEIPNDSVAWRLLFHVSRGISDIICVCLPTYLQLPTMWNFCCCCARGRVVLSATSATEEWEICYRLRLCGRTPTSRWKQIWLLFQLLLQKTFTANYILRIRSFCQIFGRLICFAAVAVYVLKISIVLPVKPNFKIN